MKSWLLLEALEWKMECAAAKADYLPYNVSFPAQPLALAHREIQKDRSDKPVAHKPRWCALALLELLQRETGS